MMQIVLEYVDRWVESYCIEEMKVVHTPATVRQEHKAVPGHVTARKEENEMSFDAHEGLFR